MHYGWEQYEDLSNIKDAQQIRNQVKITMINGLSYYKDRIRDAYDYLINNVASQDVDVKKSKVVLKNNEKIVFDQINSIKEYDIEDLSDQTIYKIKNYCVNISGFKTLDSLDDTIKTTLFNFINKGYNAVIQSANASFALMRSLSSDANKNIQERKNYNYHLEEGDILPPAAKEKNEKNKEIEKLMIEKNKLSSILKEMAKDNALYNSKEYKDKSDEYNKIKSRLIELQGK